MATNSNSSRPTPTATPVASDDKETLRATPADLDKSDDDAPAQDDTRGFDGGAALVTLTGGTLNVVSYHPDNDAACDEGSRGVAGTRDVYVLPLGKVRQRDDKDGD